MATSDLLAGASPTPWLALAFAPRLPAASSPTLAGPPGQLVWQTAEGRVAAVSFRRDGADIIDIPGVAQFRAGALPPIVAAPFGDTTEEAVRTMFHRFALPMFLQVRGAELLHASAVQLGAGVLVLCAESGTGKSTTACALADRGHPAWADDIVALDLRAASPRVLGLPFSFRVSASFFPDGPPPGRAAEQSALAPLAGIVLLERGEAGIMVNRLSEADAFRQLFPHALCFDLSDATRTAEMFEGFAALAATVPVHRVTFEPGPEHQPALLEAIEALGSPP